MLTRAILRALCALLIGFLLVSNPTDMTVLLVQIIGGLFVLSGIVAFIGFFVMKRNAQSEDASFRPVFPIVGVGSLALGVMLLLMPMQFVNILMYVLGVLLCLVAAGQIICLIGNRHFAPISWSLFVLPLLLFAAGIVVLLRPMQAASLPFLILGGAFILYGVVEFIFGIRFYRYRRIYEAALAARQAAEAREVEAVELSGDDDSDDSDDAPTPSDTPDIPIDITR